ncbi:flagellar basal-body MS-ring/collar protein FliF [Massilia solisilvae]|uniref:Flagellar M-ring protein n=1 Tax=Massilia solisilvae TaxID=1811225 RepID=A0ABT2BEW4_9BURK|nr:flagellar basal-body MS-ring/collar protein FliF [Massilia solisilvae]MCS0607045.1 flagellar basal-body MS-ring/collar protein FliF [Massilia solisilvae]
MAAAEDADNQPQPFLQTAFGRNIVLGVVAAVALAVAVALWMWSQQPEYRVLFSNYSDRDGGAITASLDQMGVKYKFSEGGSAILVTADQVHDVRLKLAAQGLPKGGNVGFELMENQKLGVSQFLEQVNYQRSLEGELARSIQSLGAVASARVHLAMPKPSVFVREQQKPTASVLLTLQPGRALDRGQVSAIVHLVASSVPELTTGNVTVVDQNGNLLSDPNNGAGAHQLDPNQLKYVEQLQANIAKQVESIITPLVGQGNVRAEATAEVDFAQVDTAAEMYKPNSPPEPQAIRSQQTAEASPAPAPASGVPGALSNNPPNNPNNQPNNPQQNGSTTTAGQQAPANPQPATNAHREATTNFEVDKTVRYEQKPMGGIKRLTVGVVVNYRRTIDAKTGKVSATPLPPAVVAQINELVKQAMGYNAARGDTLNVTNAPFEGVDKLPEAPPALAWYRDPETVSLASTIGKYVMSMIIVGFLYMRFGRPLLRRYDQIAEPPPEPDPNLAAQEQRALLEAEMEEAEAHQQAKGYRSNLQMAKDLARDDPRVVANVVKTWVGANE